MTEQSNLSLTPRRYGALIVDPPWDVNQKGSKGAIRHYNLMTLSEIKAMPIAELTEPDSHCWIWCTNATLRDAYDVLEAWQFVPRSPLTWIKPRLGLGSFLRNMTEHVILGTRGNAPVKFRSQGTWMFAPVQEHSRKPEEFYQIVKRVSHGPYLELFARRREPGFDAWGNEIDDSDIVIPGYPVPSDRNHSGNGGATS
ncbi:MT-A70 family methyltransferase [Nocardia brasiliensis]|uniref:MT-A70 family methyltransferase n=1 Tax=Nocardia brasiliensis TaxID=37326 RepID=UPI003D9007F8